MVPKPRQVSPRELVADALQRVAQLAERVRGRADPVGVEQQRAEVLVEVGAARHRPAAWIAPSSTSRLAPPDVRGRVRKSSA